MQKLIFGTLLKAKANFESNGKPKGGTYIFRPIARLQEEEGYKFNISTSPSLTNNNILTNAYLVANTVFADTYQSESADNGVGYYRLSSGLTIPRGNLSQYILNIVLAFLEGVGLSNFNENYDYETFANTHPGFENNIGVIVAWKKDLPNDEIFSIVINQFSKDTLRKL